eukprot:TRINITY_DN1454_c1_g1_i1.p1 TRINITY_DN1454_c1_g1~~TRINITY_DN1454_c1_g1_i1.p1  ORF type:complete len:357 (+),score=83.75 TRINITY_DN1454_c1_g1_i1:47-1072(+)
MTALLFTTCALFAGVPTANGASPLFAPPQFFSSENCTGDADPTAALWGFTGSQDDVMVRPFSAPEWFSWFAINACLTDDSVAYSVMLGIDTTACPSKGGDALQLLYWKDSTMCEGTATSVTTLPMGTCVETPLGSAEFKPDLTPDQLCVMTNMRTAMTKGGIRTRGWQGGSCKNGPAIVNTVTRMVGGAQPCGAVPVCNGCCALRDASCKLAPGPMYNYASTACKNLGGGKWDAATVDFIYSDDTCTVKQDSTNPVLGKPIHIGSCVTVTVQGVTVSTLVEFEAPLTMDTYCQYVEQSVNRSVKGFISWDEFNKITNGAPTAHPAVSALSLVLLLVAAVLF